MSEVARARALVTSLLAVLCLACTGPATVQLLRWFGLSTELQAPLFAASRGGLSLRYTGPLVKRGAPSSDGLLSLAPGQAVSAEVSLDGAGGGDRLAGRHARSSTR